MSPPPLFTQSEYVKCPELLWSAADLEKKVSIRELYRKVERYQSDWRRCYVAIFASSLYYYDSLTDAKPHGVIPLYGCKVDPLYRAHRSFNSFSPNVWGNLCDSDQSDLCWKFISSAGRVLIFRTESPEERDYWVNSITQATNMVGSTLNVELCSSPSEPFKSKDAHTVDMIPELSQMVRDAVALVKTQKQELQDLKVKVQSLTIENDQYKIQVQTLQSQLKCMKRSNLTSSSTEYDNQSTRPFGDNVNVPKLFATSSLPSMSFAIKSSKSSLESSEPETYDSGIYDQPLSPSSSFISRTRPMSARMSFDLMDNDYIQQQALQIAEIARKLQISMVKKEPIADSKTCQSENVAQVDAASFTTTLSQDRVKEVMPFPNQTLESAKSRIKAPDPETAEPTSCHSESACIHEDEHSYQLAARRGGRAQSAWDQYTHQVQQWPNNNAFIKKKLGISEFSEYLMEDGLSLLGCILDASSREEKVSILFPVLRLFASEKRLDALIFWAIETEVASVNNVATLFRSDNYASRLVLTYSKAVGFKFVQNVLREPIRQISTIKAVDVELLTSKTENSEQRRENAVRVMDICQKLLDSVIANIDQLPSTFFHICYHLNTQVFHRFDYPVDHSNREEGRENLTRNVVGGFLFLRLICPAIATPHLYELTPEAPTGDTRKVLVLITKLLFKAATCVKFNDRETHLEILNEFIDRNAQRIQEMYSRMTSIQPKDPDMCFQLDSDSIFSNLTLDQLTKDEDLIREIAQEHVEEIEVALQKEGFDDVMLDQLRQAIHCVEKTGEDLIDPIALQVSSKRSYKLRFAHFGRKMRTE